jgi:hypothetical protein
MFSGRESDSLVQKEVGGVLGFRHERRPVCDVDEEWGKKAREPSRFQQT